MATTVFWSWQSDLENRVTREVIRFALDEAIGILSADLEEADRPSLTSDTQGVAGTPDIVATILRKIDEAAVFVGDVTPIAVSASGKACANPNVLLEMGYANRALGNLRVIQVWNTAFDGATLEKLPFDMRGRRGPLAFHLSPDADTATLRAARSKLAQDLAAALKMAFAEVPSAPPDAVHWQPHFERDPDLWFNRLEVQTITNPRHGSAKIRWKDHFPGYARIIPSNWAAVPGAKQSMADHPGHPGLLADPGSLGFGVSRGGAAIYWPGPEKDGVTSTVAITQWFEKTGEIWGVGGGFLFERTDDRLTLATGYFHKHWCYFLQRNCTLALKNGGSMPIHVRLGISNISGSWWPRGPFDFGSDGYAAVENSYEYVATLTSTSPETIRSTVDDAFNGLAAAYGLGPFTAEQILGIIR